MCGAGGRTPEDYTARPGRCCVDLLDEKGREGGMVCRREGGGGTDDKAELCSINKDPNLQTNKYKLM